MNRWLTICIIQIMIFGFLTGVSAQNFGSKVKYGDDDLNLPLSSFSPGPELACKIGYWDIGANPGYYDKDDVVYLHNGKYAEPTPIIAANDVRLTRYQNFAPGSKVQPGDNDIGQQLTIEHAGLYYMDLFGTVDVIDFEDPMYLKIIPKSQGSPPNLIDISTGDIRLTNFVINATNKVLFAGEKVNDFNEDNYRPAKLISQGSQSPYLGSTNILYIGIFKFYNANGNFKGTGTGSGIEIYDQGDEIYIDVPTLTQGHVSVGDVRLTQIQNSLNLTRIPIG